MSRSGWAGGTAPCGATLGEHAAPETATGGPSAPGLTKERSVRSGGQGLLEAANLSEEGDLDEERYLVEKEDGDGVVACVHGFHPTAATHEEA